MPSEFQSCRQASFNVFTAPLPKSVNPDGSDLGYVAACESGCGRGRLPFQWREGTTCTL